MILLLSLWMNWRCLFYQPTIHVNLQEITFWRTYMVLSLLTLAQVRQCINMHQAVDAMESLEKSSKP